MSSETDLASKHCIPCRGGVPKIEGQELENLASQVPGWSVIHGHHLERRFAFPDFKQALGFTNRVGELAERENHHPEIQLGWGHVALTLWTHAIDGLSEADFVLAAKISQLPR